MDLIYTGACRYCGQVASSIHSFDDEDAANDWATSVCNCKDALVERNRRNEIENAKFTLSLLCGEACVERGFTTVDAETLDFLRKTVDHIGRGLLSSSSNVLPDGSIIKIKGLAEPGKMKITRKAVREVSM